MINPAKKIQRASQIFGILAKYGFKDIVARLSQKNEVSLSYETELSEESLYTRIRMVLEELGPAFVKLGQMATTREGLLPSELVEALKKLEDRVEPFELDVKSYLLAEFGEELGAQLAWVEELPFASASISQVYRAELRSGEQAVIKIRRPHIDESLRIDLALMKDFAAILANYSATLKKMNLPLIVNSFAITLEEEISLSLEAQHIQRFQRNFKDHTDIYVPQVFMDLCSDNILCMEFLDGTKITEVETLKAQGHKLKSIVDKGLNLYLTQIIDHGFFHGDPHPGNLMVMPDGRIAFLDFGNMGKMLPVDRKQLEDFITASMERNAPLLGEVLEDMSIHALIQDRSQYERQLSELFSIMEEVSIGELNLQEIFSKIWKIIGVNEMYFPEYIYQLLRGISLIEGIGRTLNPDLNILKAIDPFAKKIIKERLNPIHLAKEGFKKFRSISRDLEQMPQEIKALLKQAKAGNFTLNHKVQGIKDFNFHLQRSINKIVVAVIFLALSMLSGMMILAHVKPDYLGIPILAWIILAINSILLVYLLTSMLRGRNRNDYK